MQVAVMAEVAADEEGSVAAKAEPAAGVGGLQEVVVGIAARLTGDRCNYTGAYDRMQRQPRGTTGPSGRPVPRSGSRTAPQSCRLTAMCRVGAGRIELSWQYQDHCAHCCMRATQLFPYSNDAEHI